MKSMANDIIAERYIVLKLFFQPYEPGGEATLSVLIVIDFWFSIKGYNSRF
jgi:hypothetical protein